MSKLPAGHFAEGTYSIQPGQFSAAHQNLFFCCGGSLVLRRRDNPVLELRDQEILLFSDLSDVISVTVEGSLMGYRILIDAQTARSSFLSIYRHLGHTDLSEGLVEQLLDSRGGCMKIPSTCWTQSVFSVLRSLPTQEQGPYCVMKIAELFYLLCVHDSLLDACPCQTASLGCSVTTIRNVHDYMEANLGEKLTIQELSRQFHLSSTALKSGFRSLYGQPIHSWLQNRRIQKAAELLRFSDLNILEIAQSVGYEGLSQFNVIFKRVYGLPPSHYRKMSDSRLF